MVYKMGIRNVIVVGLGNYEASFTPLPITDTDIFKVFIFNIYIKKFNNMKNNKHIQSFREHQENLNISDVMNSKIKINENVDEHKEIIEDSYNDYISLDDKRQREIMARHIKRTAQGFIRNSGGRLEDWLEKFKDEDIVISKLKEI
jgi:hypothetical protein